MRLLFSLLTLLLCCCQVQSQASLRFDGIDDYIYVSSYSSLDWGQDFTIKAGLVQPDFSASSTLTIAERYDKEKKEGWQLHLTAHSLALTIAKQTYEIPFTIQKQTDLMVVRQKKGLYFYANGKLIGEATIEPAVTSVCAGCDVYFGNAPKSSTPFKGYMGGLYVWDRALSLEEISIAEPTPLEGLVGSWNFINGTGQFVDNNAAPLHYGRLGNTFYQDEQDPARANFWEGVLTSTAPDFFIVNKNPVEGEVILLNVTLEASTSYWLINAQKYAPEQLFEATFASGMNIIQLVQTTSAGTQVTTKMVTIEAKSNKACASSELLAWRQTTAGRKVSPTHSPVLSKSKSNPSAQAKSAAAGGPYMIPVVFHIIGTQAELDAFNLASGRVEDQLLELNTQFSNNNTNISFCLAKRLPADLVTAGRTWASFGTASTPGRAGVTYTLDDATTNLNISTFNYSDGGLIFNRLPSALPFAPEEYMSVYVTPTVLLSSGNPVDGVANVGSSGEPVDGPAIAHSAFTNTTNNVLGRTLVHEVGHWLSLHHVFGPNGDLVDDTYTQATSTQNQPSGTPPITNCTTPYTSGTPTVPFTPYFQGQNHMDYHTEICRDVLTTGQVDRMHDNLDNDRTFIHTTLNLINTGVQDPNPSACLVGPNFTADFTLSSGEICEGNAFTAKGFAPPSGVTATFSWNVTWSTGNTTPAPSFTVSQSNPTGYLNAITITGVAAAGLWTVELTMVANGTTTLVSTNDIRLLNCAVGPERFRKTTNFANGDWILEQISIASARSRDAQNNWVDGYVVIGSDSSVTPTRGALLFVDALGDILWRKAITSPSEAVRLYDVAAPITYLNNPDCYAITGYVEANGKKEVLVIITDELGNTLYQERFPISENGSVYNYAIGKQIIQLSNAFGNQLAVVGWAGNSPDVLDAKAGFVLGIDPNQALGSTIQWSQFYETTPHNLGQDHDFIENIVETTTTINGQQKEVLIVSGNSNRTARWTSSIFSSCLTVTSNIVTEEWRKNYEAFTNTGAYEALGTVEDNGRVFMMGYGEISHGSFMCEVNTSNGDLGDVFEIRGFLGDELIIDNGYCVAFGKNRNDNHINAYKMPLPATFNDPWGASSLAITRRYEKTVNTNNYSASENGLQNFVQAPNGGYMGITAVEIAQAGSGSNLEMTMIKIDDFLVNGCINQTDLTINSLLNPFSQVAVAQTSTATVVSNPVVINTNLEGAVCMESGCLDAYHSNKTAQKCTGYLQLLVNDVVPSGAQYSYQWSPSTDLNDPTIMEPTTNAGTQQVYNLIVTNTITGCQAASVTYTVTVPTTVYSNTQQIVCNTSPATSFQFQLLSNLQTGYNYFWSPSTHLDNPFVLQPNCSAVTSQTYQLMAIPNNGVTCNTHIVDYEVIVNDPVPQEIEAFCIDTSYSGYFFDNTYPSYFQHRYYLADLFTHFFGPLPSNGYWVVEPFNQGQSSFNGYNSMPRFDVSNNSIVSGVVFNGQVEYLTYVYPDPTAACGTSTMKLKLYPDNVIQSTVGIEICPGETVTFQGNPVTLDPSLNPTTQWFVATSNNCAPTTIHTPSSNTFTYTFPNPASCTNYSVAKQVFYECPDPNNAGGTIPRGVISNTINVAVLTAVPTITEGCFGFLGIQYSNNRNTSYEWYEVGNPIPLATSSFYQASQPGDYYVEVTSSQGCDFVTPVYSYQGQLSSTWSAGSLSCNTTTKATVVPSGGTAPYTYQWSVSANSQTTATATGLTAGNHDVVITDANGCTTSTTVQIAAANPLQNQLNVTPISCNVANSAAITSTVSGGAAPYTYLWSSGATTPDLTGTQIPTAGTYCVDVTDAAGCVVTTCGTIAPVVDIDFSKTSAVARTQAGNEVGYTIFMKNNCQYPVTFDLTDELPVGVVPTVLGIFNYNTTAHTLTQQVTLAGGAQVSYEYKVLVIADGICDDAILLENRATAQSVDIPSISYVDNAVVEVREKRNNCDISSMDITFAQAIQAGVLLPMTGPNNAPNVSQTVVINGTWHLSPGQVYQFAPGSTIIMEAGAEIVIAKGAELTLSGTEVRGCDCMWHRILVNPRGELIVEDKSLLMDAQYAIETTDNSSLSVVGSIFENNFIGWYTAPVGSPMSQRVSLKSFSENTFSSSSLKPAFLNAPLTPAITDNDQATTIALPLGNNNTRLIGLAGIYMWDVEAMSISAPVATNNNNFEKLVTGITAFNSNLFVNNANFVAIEESATFAANLGFQGAGIHSQGQKKNLPTLEVRGTRQTSGATTFSSCDVGVSTIRAATDVDFCVMEQINQAGIRAIDCNSTGISLKANLMLNVERVGIECRNNQGSTYILLAYNDIVLQSGSMNGQFRAGISAENCSHLGAELNYVESNNSQYGIVLEQIAQASLEANEILMIGSYNNIIRTGIAVNNSQSYLSCNIVNGTQDVRLASNTRALSGNNVNNSVWKCNQLYSTYTGAYFERFNSIALQGTVFNEHNTGLFLSSNAVLGHQFEHGNVWEPGTMVVEAENQNLGNLSASIFEVNPAMQVPNTWPNALIPNNNTWFVFSNGPDNTYNCNTAAANNSPICGALIAGFPARTAVNNGITTAANDGHSTKEKDNQEAQSLEVYPNPAFQYLTLESNQLLSKACQIEVYNALGQLMPVAIQVQTTNQVVVDVSQLTAGFYTIRLLDKGEQSNQTFVVSKP